MRARLQTLAAAFVLLIPTGEPNAAESNEPASARGLEVPTNGKTGFSRMPSGSTGITFTNHLSDAMMERSRILENGSGVALGDVNGDGLCDIYLCRLEGANVLYLNRGNWKFAEASSDSNIACADQLSTGAVLSDIDGDFDLDLLVTSIGGGTRSFRNDGAGRFIEDLQSGLIRKTGSTSMALADIDRDGDLDLYVANYRTNTIRDGFDGNVRITGINGAIVAKPARRFEVVTAPNGKPVVFEKGEPDHLYLNDGTGRFTSTSWTDGRFTDADGQTLTSPHRHWGLAVAMRDFTGDGAPDIYVCNDFIDSPDDVWINDGLGRFRAVERLVLRNTSWSSMALDFADINRDGLADLFVVDMLSRSHRLRQTQRANADMANVAIEIGEIDNRPQYMRNTLFLNRGDGTFAEIAQLCGLQASDWSWSPIFLDVDLDGFEDLLITNGNAHDVQDADTAVRSMEQNRGIPRNQQSNTLLMYPKLDTRNVAFRNRGDMTFEETGGAWGFDDSGISQGMATGDLDNDGDLDVVVNNLNHAAGLYRNESSAPRLAIRLVGLGKNTRGIGAKIEVSGGPVQQSQEVISGSRYLSGDDPMRVFAAGTESAEMLVKVSWRSGAATERTALKANHVYEIKEPDPDFGTLGTANTDETTEGEPAPGATRAVQNPKSKIQYPPSPIPFFEDVSGLINHKHHETPYGDFNVQRLLPHRFSQLGPGIAWHDLNGDQFEDLIIGSGRGGKLAVFQNDRKGGFRRLQDNGGISTAIGDQTSIVGFSAPGLQPTVLVGISNYEGGSTSQGAIMQYQGFSREINEMKPFAGQTSMAGPMALADIDGDGDPDLFVGGRLNPKRYPEPATSRVFRFENGHFRLDRALSQPFVDLGMASGVVFSDLDSDGDPDLVLACDWSPLRVFRNEAAGFVEVTEALGLSQFRGRWNGVTTGDFNNDGRLDIVASNWGRNTKFQRFLHNPLRLYYADFDFDGTLEVIEACFDPEVQAMVPWRGFISMSRALPFLRQTIGSFDAYGRSTIQSLLGERMKNAVELTVTTLDAMIFMNTGARFEGRALPIEAQFAPSFGVNTGDFDGDGNEDIFLSQNFFAVYSESSRHDAGRGLWLRGNGRGGFAPVPGVESGVLVYGEQRGSALCDFDHDGRTDLAVTQNGAATKLYRNVRAKPGIRVRLEGARENPDGIGAQLRLVYERGMGPTREIHAGSGYWSQDSATQVMCAAQPAKAIWVRWPGGKTAQSPIAAGQREVVLEAPRR